MLGLECYSNPKIRCRSVHVFEPLSSVHFVGPLYLTSCEPSNCKGARVLAELALNGFIPNGQDFQQAKYKEFYWAVVLHLSTIAFRWVDPTLRRSETASTVRVGE
eukprot:763989-Amphidinium_carterae.3